MLPLLSTTALQVLEQSRREDTDAKELADIVQMDPALTAHVLRTANSTAFCPAEPIISLSQAISRLGLHQLSAIVVAVVVKEEVFRLPGFEKELEALWKHSALAGGWSSEIARLRRANVESAFLAGLLHEVGKPVVLSALSSIEELSSCSLDAGIYADWLVEFHEPVACRLLTEWGFPERLVEAVTNHHNPEGASDYPQDAKTTCLADLLAHWSASEDEDEREVLEKELRAHPSVAGLNLYTDDMDNLLSAEERVRETAEAFQ
ncbi:MAG: HD-like signal output (HDOD) protein [Planctomycetota bacterium]